MMVGASLAFLSQRVLWEKLIITASAVPIAIFCNVLRVSGQGLLDRYVSHEWSEGFAHQFAGLIMIIPGFFLILLVGWILERLFIEEVKRGRTAAASAAAAGGDAGSAPSRGKRMIVEVPRKREPVDAPAAPAPAAAATPAPAMAAPAAPAKPAVAKPPAPVKPPAAAAQVAMPPAAKPAPAAAAQVAKPAPKPAPAVPAKALTPPPAGLKPSPPRMTLPPQGLKPSAKPAPPAVKPQQPSPSRPANPSK
jgi:exosortase/archaeosortase family protein